MTHGKEHTLAPVKKAAFDNIKLEHAPKYMGKNGKEIRAPTRLEFFSRTKSRIKIELPKILFPTNVSMMIKIRTFRQLPLRVWRMNLWMHKPRNITAFLRE